MTDDAMEDVLRSYFARTEGECDQAAVLLERLVNGQEDDWEIADRGHRAECEACAEVVALVRAADSPAADSIFADFGSTARVGRRRWRRWGVAAAAAAALLLGWLAVTGPTIEPPERVLAKGEWSLHVGIKRGGRSLRYDGEQAFVDGDELGFFYSSPTDGFLLVMFVDSAGQKTVVVPQAGTRALPVRRGSEVRLNAGGQLTSTTHCEWLVGVFSNAPFDFSQVSGGLDTAPRTPDGPCTLSARLPASWSHRTIRLAR